MNTTRLLLDIQETDLEIARAKKRLEDLPEKLQILKVRAQRTEVEAKGVQVDAARSSLDGEIKKFEHETGKIDEKLSAEQVRLNASKDHRAVASITKEMAGLERRKKKIEFDEMGILEKIEKVSALQGQVAEMLAKIDCREAQLIEQYRAAGGEVQHHVAELVEHRTAIAEKLPKKVLERYEQIRETHRGVAVSRLEGPRCSVCRVDLTAAQLDTLARGEDIALCPSCHRIILVRGFDS